MRFLFLLLFIPFLFATRLAAQARNELFVTVTDDTWNISHRVQKGETLFMLSRRYHVPPAILADANNLSYQDGLREASSVVIPLGAYNLQTQKPAANSEARPLYYKVMADDNLYRISRHAGVPQRSLVQWNTLPQNEVSPGQKLLVGWVLYDNTQMNTAQAVVPATPPVINTNKPAQPVKPADTVRRPPVRYEVAGPVTISSPDTVITIPQAPPVVTLRDLYEEQTMQEQNVVQEKGAAAFFTMSTQAKGASVYAFHNKAAKGSVIKVKNLNNGRFVFVKVLGPLPVTKQYYNCIVGLSGSAKAALGVRDNKAFCELSYAGY